MNFIRMFFLFVCVQREVDNDAKVGKLLDLIERRGPKAFDGLVKALKVTEQDDAAGILTEAAKKHEMPNGAQAANGNIPFQLCSCSCQLSMLTGSVFFVN